MNHTEEDKQSIKKILADLDLAEIFKISQIIYKDSETIEFSTEISGKIFRIVSCHPLLFCNEHRQ